MRDIDTALLDMVGKFAELVRGNLKGKGFRHTSLYEAFLQEGQLFPAEPYTAEEEELLLDIFGQNRREWAVKQCFYNAQLLSTQDCRLGYAEGYVFMPDLPIFIEHAWNFLPESGKPVDITLRGRREGVTCDPAELFARASNNLANSYLGVPISKDEVRKDWLRSGRARAFLDLPEIQRKVLHAGFPEEWKQAS